MLKVDHVFSGYGEEDILKDISFKVGKSEFVCILGSNGCGKTTLLKTILAILKPTKGKITINDDDVHKMPEKLLAQQIAYIPQAHVPPFPFTVEDVVLMGRTPYLNRMAVPNALDVEKSNQALERLGMTNMAKKRYTELSGGQRQMVIIARALAQEPKMLVMDEPTANLDFGNQHIVFEQLIKLAHKDLSVLMVTHNPDHALFCADETIIMKEGKVIDKGKTSAVVNESSMQEIYQTDVKIASVDIPPQKQIFICVPISKQKFLLDHDAL